MPRARGGDRSREHAKAGSSARFVPTNETSPHVPFLRLGTPIPTSRATTDAPRCTGSLDARECSKTDRSSLHLAREHQKPQRQADVRRELRPTLERDQHRSIRLLPAPLALSTFEVAADVNDLAFDGGSVVYAAISHDAREVIAIDVTSPEPWSKLARTTAPMEPRGSRAAFSMRSRATGGSG